eukprot:1227478-Amphidinium_carterae.2
MSHFMTPAQRCMILSIGSHLIRMSTKTAYPIRMHQRFMVAELRSCNVTDAAVVGCIAATADATAAAPAICYLFILLWMKS